MSTYINSFPEKKSLLDYRNMRTFFTTVNTGTIWVVEFFNDFYGSFYTESLNVSLIGKNVLSCGGALCRAEQFIKNGK